MKEERIRKRFEVTVNILTLFASILLISSAIDQYSGRQISRWFFRRGTSENIKGTRLPTEMTGVPQTPLLVMALSTACHYCQQEIPMYRELVGLVRGRRVGIAAVFPQDRASAERFLSEAGLSDVRVLPNSPAQLGIRGTPTLLLVNTHGVVEESLTGAGRISAHEIAVKLAKLE
jgi:thiol-disulfide isomerase/thioredoxin